jgi:hypothetical protein
MKMGSGSGSRCRFWTRKQSVKIFALVVLHDRVLDQKRVPGMSSGTHFP